MALSALKTQRRIRSVAPAPVGDPTVALIRSARRWDITPNEALLHAPTIAPSDIAARFAHDLGTAPLGKPSLAPDATLAAPLPFSRAQALGVCPWQRIGGQVVILAADPSRVETALPALQAAFGAVRVAMVESRSLDAAQAALYRTAHKHNAESATAAEFSCRSLRLSALLPLAASFFFAAAVLAPIPLFALLSALAVLSLLPLSFLKLRALLLLIRPQEPAAHGAEVLPARLPVISLLVPLYSERRIAAHLIHRLQQLDYPRPLTDICLLLEEGDTTTQHALAAANLPRWMRVITVPPGQIQTKPRALNHGLTFARGQIIGIYDAEDAPAPDQLQKIARAFAAAPAQVACLQGVLDFYNSDQNWLSRCFTLEYAVWFRAVLPTLSKIGWVLPLGGTTLFFRRSVLEEIGGWDAHNVTEDADLGLRLARFGYQTALVPTVTYEESNCRPWPWVRQRSRWLKGYAMTYATHMRAPVGLWRSLGTWRFIGVQVLFLGTLLQFTLAPLLWSFWLLALGLPHPLSSLLPDSAVIALAALFILSEVISIALAMVAASRTRHASLLIWAPTLHLYFPLAALAMYKGLWEMIARPFYWDKTSHGHSAARPAATPRHAPQQPRHPV